MHDTGTPELVMKRALGATTESLDLCLERGIITHQQHWCGIHLRWLYTLRFGAPGVRAVDPTHMGGVDVKADDPKWRAAREVEYLEAITLLRGSAAALLAVVIHNERPEFLNHRPECFSGNAEKRINASMINFTKGLDTLCVLWCTPNVKS